jgi:fibronectin type 3 domain-containing protein
LSPKEGKDYTVSYSNNLKIGTATITYRFYGNYNGIITKDFLIVPDSVTKFSAKIKGDKTILSWNAVKGASGYEIKRSTKKNGKYKVIARIKNKKKYTDQKAKGKKYYYKVRAFGKQGGTRCYGKEVVVRAKR